MERAIYQRIDELLEEQFQLMCDYDWMYNCSEELVSSRQSSLLSVQRLINEQYDLLKNARSRAQSQIVYNDRIKQSYAIDGRKSVDMLDYVMITLNPQPAILHKELMIAVRSFMSLCVVEYGCYNIEQRSDESGVYEGFHSHMCFKRARRPSEVLKEVYRLFDPLVGSRKSIVIKSQSKAEDVTNYIGYMLGKKDDPLKLPKVEVDREMRATFGYDPVYFVGGTPPTCWASRLLPNVL